MHRREETPVRKIVLFVVLAFVFTWAWWVPLAVAGVVVEPGQGWPTHLPGLLGPALAAVVVTAATEGRAGLAELWSRVTRWRVSWIWYLLVVATVALALTGLVLTPGATPPDLLVYSGAPEMGLALVLYVLVVNGFGEEIGWRGFLAHRLLETRSTVATAVLVWLVWGVWHLPMFWVVGSFRDFGIAGTVGWAVGLGLGSVFLTWLYRTSGRSVLVTALWHTAYNLTTATSATAGTTAVVTSSVPMVAAVVVLLRRSSWQDARTTRGTNAAVGDL